MRTLCIAMFGLWLTATAPARPFVTAPADTARTTIAAAAGDSVGATRNLSVVVVMPRAVQQTVIPPQTLSGSLLRDLNANSVADALRYFSGAQLKDYGGVGGIKTVDVRSMGSQHVGVFYDGIALGNAQNGQIDLGQFSLDNVEAVSLYNGQKSNLLQTAADYAGGASVYIRTRRPDFSDSRHRHLRFHASYGAAGQLRLSGLWEQRLSSSVSTSFNIGTLTASGRYKFRYKRNNPDGSTAYDTTATRHGGDIQALRAELNAYGQSRHDLWNIKAYAYVSDRGIPGAIVNNVWRRGERQSDANTFFQGQWQRNVSDRLTARLTAKWAWYRTHYLNRDTTQLPVDNRYFQQEAYVSASVAAVLTPWWNLSAAYDFRWNKLNADVYAFVRPRRQTHMGSVATLLSVGRVRLQGALAATYVHDTTTPFSPTPPSDKEHNDRSELTPSFFISYSLPRLPWLQLHAFAKKSYRMPTFNDLYYTNMGNAGLRPESVLQYDAGLTLARDVALGWLRRLALKADIYANAVHDKIIAYPKGQQFRWTMLNLGKVHATGADVSGEVSLRPAPLTVIDIRLQYSYQDARDVTDRATPYYDNQIPYIPRHSGTVAVDAKWRSWTVFYSFIYTGERWNEQENIAYNHVEPWYTHDLSLQYDFSLGGLSWRAVLQVNNVFNQQYEVISNYPMPGRNANVALRVEI